MDSQHNNDLREFLQDFRRTIEITSARLLEIPEAQSQISKREDKWSPREIIGHLIDSAANNHQRFVRAQFSDELVYAGKHRLKSVPFLQLIRRDHSRGIHIRTIEAQDSRRVARYRQGDRA